jgi:hypothetical protein
MADAELVRVVDYILNRCDEEAIEAVAAAVVRRRRDLSLFGGAHNLPDPRKMARDLSAQINLGATVDGLKDTIRDMAVRMIRQEAPELTEDQVAELIHAWVPDHKAGPGDRKQAPPELMESMVDQFVAYSLGRMDSGEDQRLRAELGAWPERYWKAFSPVVQLIITDFLKNEIGEEEFRSKIGTALMF